MSVCHTMGGKMAAPHSLDELQFMVEVARNKNNNYYVWIACNDKKVEGSWECDGQEGGKPFLKWAPQQPDDYWQNQDCAAIAAVHDSNMDDGSCISQHDAMCVRPATCTHRPTQPRLYCLPTDTLGRILDSACLLDHNIREFVTEGVTDCGSACAKEPGCRSFNIKKSGGGKKLCQLNNSTRSDDADKFQNTDHFCIYFELCIG